MSMSKEMSDHMDEKTCYEWGNLFASSWSELVEGMARRAAEAGLEQEAGGHCMVWTKGGEAKVRFLFVDDPSMETSLFRPPWRCCPSDPRTHGGDP